VGRIRHPDVALPSLLRKDHPWPRNQLAHGSGRHSRRTCSESCQPGECRVMWWLTLRRRSRMEASARSMCFSGSNKRRLPPCRGTLRRHPWGMLPFLSWRGSIAPKA
jgi:hypothetical protein